MLRHKIAGFWIIFLCGCLSIQAAAGKIIKVLPHLLDEEGLHSRTPSLYERDAYQAYLRKHPEKCSALEYAIQWRARHTASANLKLRIELRTAKTGLASPVVKEIPVRARSWMSRWTPVKFTGEEFKKTGDILAWRVTLWDGPQQLAEQRSFLW